MKILVISFVELAEATKEEIRKEFKFQGVELDFATSLVGMGMPGWKTVWARNSNDIELIKKQIKNMLRFEPLRSMF